MDKKALIKALKVKLKHAETKELKDDLKERIKVLEKNKIVEK